MLEAFIFGIDSQGCIAEHRLWTRCFDVNDVFAVFRFVANLPHMADGFFVFHLKVTHGALQLGIPVHQAFAAVNQAFVIKTHEGFGYDLAARFVHREIKPFPI